MVCCKLYRSSKHVAVVESGMADLDSKLSLLEKQFESRVSSLMNDISQLKRSVNEAQQQRDQIQERLDKVEQRHCKTKAHEQKYLDTVRQCCIELLLELPTGSMYNVRVKVLMDIENGDLDIVGS